MSDDPRDTIYFKHNGVPPFRAKYFKELSLNTDFVLLNPQVLATVIYADKSITDKEKKKVNKLKSRYLSWKSKQRGSYPVYLKIKHLKEADPSGDGGGGRGGGGGVSKRIKKSDLIKPMEDLAGQYSELHELIGDNNNKANAFLTGNMTDTLKKLLA